MRLYSSFKKALSANFLLVAVLPVLFFGLIAINIMYEHQVQGLRDLNMVHAVDIADEGREFLQEVKFDLMLVSETVSSDLLTQPDQVDAFLKLTVRNSQFLESIYVLDEYRKVIHLGILPRLASRQADYYQIDLSAHQLFEDYPTIQEPVWSNTFVSLVTGEPTITLAVPIGNKLVLGNINLISLSRLLQRYSVGRHASFAIIDRDGVVVAHMDPKRAMQRENFLNHPIVAEALKGREATAEHLHDAERKFLESVALIDTTNWVVWVGTDMFAVLEPIYQLQDLLIGFMLVAMVTAIFIAVLNMRSLMKPLSLLSRYSKEITTGNYNLSFEKSGYSEIDTLAGQYLDMSRAIEVREQSIQASEKRFRELVNSIDGVVWEMDLATGRYLFVSNQIKALFGFTPDKWLKSPDFQRNQVHPDDREFFLTNCRTQADLLENGQCDYRMFTAEGEVLWVRDLITVIQEDDHPSRLLGITIDITRQRKLADQLKESEENYRLLVENQSELVVKVDANGRFLYVSPSYCTLFGKAEEELLGHDFLPMVHPEDQEGTRQAMKALSTPPYTCYLEQRAQTSKGWRWLAWSDTAIHDEQGNVSQIVGVGRDITERKIIEEELAQYRAHLEELVADRTRKLEEAQAELVQSERLAVLGQLTATVSHEIRNPLGTVANALYLIRDRLEEEGLADLEKPLKLAERNVERCDGIISELLDFSRQRELNAVMVAIDSWLNELLDEQRWPEDVAVQRDLNANLTLVFDPERMRRAMINAINNGLQSFAEDQSRPRKLSVISRVVGNRCEIVVEDTGVGIPAENLQKIFEPMFSTKNFGVGLGVPVIKKILEDHGGGVVYESEVGQGTRVTLWLPINS